MRLPLLLLFAFLASSAHAASMPACAYLDARWKSYRSWLGPDWPYTALACAKDEAAMSFEEKRDLNLARAAYLLNNEVQWTSKALPGAPLVQGGGITPPPNMLRWVAARSHKIVLHEKGSAFGVNGEIHLTNADVVMPPDAALEKAVGGAPDPGVRLAAQLIHEARHNAGGGYGTYGHVECTLPGLTGQMCDPTIAEDFGGGGSHAIAAIWLAWIANRTNWPSPAKKTAEYVAVEIVLKTRINDTHAVDLFACRYFGYSLWNKRQKCANVSVR